jgi:hypothetical protein
MHILDIDQPPLEFDPTTTFVNKKCAQSGPDTHVKLKKKKD